MKTLKIRRKRAKKYLKISVLDATRARLEYLYQRFDRVFIAFSGGKDSTALLNIAAEVAAKLGKLPVDVVFFDEEALPPPTVEYVERVRLRPDVRMHWYCLEFKHRNACSNEQPFWFCWDRDARDRWVREIPSWAITSHPRFERGMSYQEFSSNMHAPDLGNVVNVTGIRTEESIRRYRAVMHKRNDNYINATDLAHISLAHPLYDWSATDVWRYVADTGCDYNRTYDIYNRTKFYNRLATQRVCQPFGEEPLRSLWTFAECFPEIWPKLLRRVEGVGTAWRYANTQLYGIGEFEKPAAMGWREFLDTIYSTYPAEWQTKVRENVQALVQRHEFKTADPVPDEDGHPLTGLSWRGLCKIAAKGDFKSRTANRLENEAIRQQRKLGINSYAEALARFGRPELQVKQWNE